MSDVILENITVHFTHTKQEINVQHLFEALQKLTAEKYLKLFNLMQESILRSQGFIIDKLDEECKSM